jgi:hypothetical protein
VVVAMMDDDDDAKMLTTTTTTTTREETQTRRHREFREPMLLHPNPFVVRKKKQNDGGDASNPSTVDVDPGSTGQPRPNKCAT